MQINKNRSGREVGCVFCMFARKMVTQFRGRAGVGGLSHPTFLLLLKDLVGKI